MVPDREMLSSREKMIMSFGVMLPRRVLVGASVTTVTSDEFLGDVVGYVKHGSLMAGFYSKICLHLENIRCFLHCNLPLRCNT